MSLHLLLHVCRAPDKLQQDCAGGNAKSVTLSSSLQPIADARRIDCAQSPPEQLFVNRQLGFSSQKESDRSFSRCGRHEDDWEADALDQSVISRLSNRLSTVAQTEHKESSRGALQGDYANANQPQEQLSTAPDRQVLSNMAHDMQRRSDNVSQPWPGSTSALSNFVEQQSQEQLEQLLQQQLLRQLQQQWRLQPQQQQDTGIYQGALHEDEEHNLSDGALSLGGAHHKLDGAEHSLDGEQHDLSGAKDNLDSEQHGPDAAEHNLVGAKCNLNGAEHTLDGAEYTLDGAERNLYGIRHDLTGAEHNLDGAQHNLDDAEHEQKAEAVSTALASQQSAIDCIQPSDGLVQLADMPVQSATISTQPAEAVARSADETMHNAALSAHQRMQAALQAVYQAERAVDAAVLFRPRIN